MTAAKWRSTSGKVNSCKWPGEYNVRVRSHEGRNWLAEMRLILEKDLEEITVKSNLTNCLFSVFSQFDVKVPHLKIITNTSSRSQHGPDDHLYPYWRQLPFISRETRGFLTPDLLQIVKDGLKQRLFSSRNQQRSFTKSVITPTADIFKRPDKQRRLSRVHTLLVNKAHIWSV